VTAAVLSLFAATAAFAFGGVLTNEGRHVAARAAGRVVMTVAAFAFVAVFVVVAR